jgi:hypothetical protein
VAVESFNTSGARITGQRPHPGHHGLADFRVQLTENLTDARTSLDGVGGHGLASLQPELGLKFF